MKRLSDVAGDTLLWEQTSRRQPTYALKAGDDVIATLRWQRGSLAITDVADRSWSFKRAGFCRPRVTIRPTGSELETAIFHLNWSGTGTLEVAPERHFEWAPASFWRARWAWRDAQGSLLVSFADGRTEGRVTGHVEIDPAAIALPELGLLVSLGWYLLVLRHDESAADGATAIGGIVSATGA